VDEASYLDEATPGFMKKEDWPMTIAITRLQSHGLLNLELPQRKGLLWKKQ